MNDFYRTPMGRKFYDADLPKLIDVLEKLGKHMEESNQLQDFNELKQDIKELKETVKELTGMLNAIYEFETA